MSRRSSAQWLAGALALATACGAAAQSRPAYVKNVNEPGREPYSVQIEFFRSQCSFNCTNFFTQSGLQIILFDGPPIPAGKRAIVVNVSADLPANDAFNSISIQSSRILSNQNAKWQFHGPFFSVTPGGSQSWGMHTETFFTIEPGQQPHVRLKINSATAFSGSVLLSGYLIDANN